MYAHVECFKINVFHLRKVQISVFVMLLHLLSHPPAPPQKGNLQLPKAFPPRVFAASPFHCAMRRIGWCARFKCWTACARQVALGRELHRGGNPEANGFE